MFDENTVNELISIAKTKIDAIYENTMCKEIDELFSDVDYFKNECEIKNHTIHYTTDVKIYFLRFSDVDNKMNGLYKVSLQIRFPNRKGNQFISLDISKYFDHIDFSELSNYTTINSLKWGDSFSTVSRWYFDANDFISEDTIKHIYEYILYRIEKSNSPKNFEESYYTICDNFQIYWIYRF